MEIVDYIPRGHNNGIHRKELQQLTGLTDSAIRDLISRHNASGQEIICNIGDGQGYFLADQGEEDYQVQCIAIERSRANKILEKVDGMKRYLLSVGAVSYEQ